MANKQNHCMLDLETLDVKATGVIMSIGAVAFDPFSKGVGSTFYTVISIDDCVESGLTISKDTVNWWLKQSPEAQTVMTEAKASQNSLCEALREFSLWWGKNNMKYLWGNGAAFDNAMLSYAYTCTEIKQPWLCWNDRCYRTMKDLAPEIKLVREGTFHNALDDAISQAKHMQEFMGGE